MRPSDDDLLAALARVVGGQVDATAAVQAALAAGVPVPPGVYVVHGVITLPAPGRRS